MLFNKHWDISLQERVTKTFQNMVILIRDWECQREFSYGYYDDKFMPPGQPENLKDRLFETEDKSLGSEAKSSITQITLSCHHLSVFALPHPRNTETLDYPKPLLNKWDHKFVTYLKEFVVKILQPSNIAKCIKIVAGKEQTGYSLSKFIEPWAEALMASEHLPMFTKTIEATANSYYTSIVLALKKEYEAGFKQFLNQNPLGLSINILEIEQTKKLKETLKLFKEKKSIGGNDLIQRFENQLKSDINKIYQEIKQLNNEKLLAEGKQSTTNNSNLSLGSNNSIC